MAAAQCDIVEVRENKSNSCENILILPEITGKLKSNQKVFPFASLTFYDFGRLADKLVYLHKKILLWLCHKII